MSLSPREHILHWQLRDRVVSLTIVCLALASIALFIFFVAVVWTAARSALVSAGSLLLFIDAFVVWRLRSAWKQLAALEQYIP